MGDGTFGVFDDTNAVGSIMTYAIQFETPPDGQYSSTVRSRGGGWVDASD
jgi:hypothetical protein